MIVVRLEGGLGNQLFQYGFGVALQQRHGGRLLFDRRPILHDPGKANALEQIVEIDQGRFADSLLVCGLRFYAAGCIRMVASRKGRTDAAARTLARLGVRHQFMPRHLELESGARLPFIYLHGNWMSEKYFDFAEDRVRSSIHPERAIGPQARNLADRMQSTNSVAVHVRRGDYLHDEWRDKLEVCTGQYYEQAVAMVQERLGNLTFYVFTNGPEDIRWVRDNYRFFPNETVFVPPGTTDVEHFALMSRCRHFIIANSTFSWWASYLSANPGKITVAPSPWNRNVWDMTDVYRRGWDTITIDLDATCPP